MTRYALLIGINEYNKSDSEYFGSKSISKNDKSFPNLGAPVGEAKKFGEILKAYGDFNITTPTCKDFIGLREEIYSFCNNKKQEDILLFYFSGHGKLVGKKGNFHFITNDTKYSKPKLKSISGQFVRESLEDSHTKAQIVILDCCHSEAFLSKGEDVTAKHINEELNAAKGIFNLCSSLSWQTSFENSDKPLNERKSFFTEILIEGIEEGKADPDNKGIITIDMLKSYIYKNITKKTDDQTPIGKIESRGCLELVRNPKFSKSGKLNCWVKEDFEVRKSCEFKVKYAKNQIEKGNYEKATQQLKEARLVCIKKVYDLTLIEEIDVLLEELNDKIPREELTHYNLQDKKKKKNTIKELEKSFQNDVKNHKIDEVKESDEVKNGEQNHFNQFLDLVTEKKILIAGPFDHKRSNQAEMHLKCENKYYIGITWVTFNLENKNEIRSIVFYHKIKNWFPSLTNKDFDKIEITLRKWYEKANQTYSISKEKKIITLVKNISLRGNISPNFNDQISRFNNNVLYVMKVIFEFLKMKNANLTPIEFKSKIINQYESKLKSILLENDILPKS